MTVVRRPKGFPTIVAAVTVWIGVMILAPAGAAASTMETLHKFTVFSTVSDRLIEGRDGKLYGTSVTGGSAGQGTVFRVNPDGTAVEVLHSFACESSDGCFPGRALTAGNDGKFYGTTSSGGGTGGGTVFRVNPDGTAFEVLHAFACESDGCDGSSLTARRDGKFYGTARLGGGAGGGTVFRVNPDGTAFEVLHSFACGSDGCNPQAGLTAGSDGKFYGTTGGGGGAGGGTVFRMNSDGTAFEVLHSFACESDGCNPQAALTAGSDGKFYGTAPSGGAEGVGTVFRVNPDGAAFEVIHAFTPEDGSFPFGALTAGSDGKFYGTTTFGGAADLGTVFRLNPDGTAFEVLHSFACGSDGCVPIAGLTAGSDGKFYGTTNGVGAASPGAIFAIDMSGRISVVTPLGCLTPCFPFAGLTAGSDGKFYGTTQNGGATNGGTVFRLNPDGTAFAVLHEFVCGSDGCVPSAGLTAGNDGRFYGTTLSDGAAGGGTVFRMNPDGSPFEVLHAFACDSDGCNPQAALTAGRDGTFYGTAPSGGATGGGTVFQLNPDGPAFRVLHAFACDSDGCNPQAGLTAGSDGKFYGTTGGGGAAGGGTVFRLNPDGSEFEVLHAFDCGSDGCSGAGLTLGNDGKFYGTALSDGAAGGGTVFRLNPDGTEFEVLHAFDCDRDGCGAAGLTLGNDGKFYGTTGGGGAAGGGTIFRLNPDGTAFEVLHAFVCGSGGCSPSAGLTAGRDGNFYGTTREGGDGGGTVFRFAAGGVTRFTGTATGVGLSGNRAGMQIVGRFTSQTNINLGAATVTMTGLLDEQGGEGELVRGLPLTLSSIPGSGPDLARFEDRTRPNFAFFDIRDLGRGEFDFRIKLGAAAIASPALCSRTRLTTGFRLDDGRTALVVSTEQPWSCSGPGNRYLKTP